MPFDQCDQIWQNLYQFGSILKFLGKILRVYLVFGKMAKLSYYWASFHCGRWPNILKLFWPSGHTALDASHLWYSLPLCSLHSFSISYLFLYYFSFHKMKINFVPLLLLFAFYLLLLSCK